MQEYIWEGGQLLLVLEQLGEVVGDALRVAHVVVVVDNVVAGAAATAAAAAVAAAVLVVLVVIADLLMMMLVLVLTAHDSVPGQARLWTWR